MNYAIYESDFGNLLFEYEEEIIFNIEKLSCMPEDKGVHTKFTDMVFNQLSEYFEGMRKTFDFSYELNGTPFQKKVWNALLEIPYGETRSYKDIAKSIGNEKASRAIGMANNKNPIIIVVPCHRVIGSDGNLVGYAGGIDSKKYLLELEQRNNL